MGYTFFDQAASMVIKTITIGKFRNVTKANFIIMKRLPLQKDGPCKKMAPPKNLRCLSCASSRWPSGFLEGLKRFKKSTRNPRNMLPGSKIWYKKHLLIVI